MMRLPGWLKRPHKHSSQEPVPDGLVSEEVLSRLRTDSPRLLELARKYEGHPAGARSRWSEEYLEKKLDLRTFREDNIYIWQERGLAEEINYVLTAYYVNTVDRLHLFDKLEEDCHFGASGFNFNNTKMISRDLLDSILEINFLDEEIGIAGKENLRVLDIGGGYGRLGHRMVTALPNIERYYCTDAIPHSTFLAEFYFDYRGIADRAVALPLDEVEQTLAEQPVDLAVNIHSFSECPIAAIDWWIGLLSRNHVRHLMIIPNDREQLLSKESKSKRLDFSDILKKHGYQLKVQRAKYRQASSIEKYGIFPADYFLFEYKNS